ncbi:hypothetical protein K503DRAFT_634181 [Rhizopogon vinicolor AM-OR11-026]|uniref:Uncharacterized protein n=1 Tax=Rhizopogon vinicolor AM-OR11-026 TaxID=1314800 RepID=A0A1B7N5V9_9AGAM|nr:hypothetical protein K503DRAFT_634181 [Rhizopogon vinicolor AM-OR11-026]
MIVSPTSPTSSYHIIRATWYTSHTMHATKNGESMRGIHNSYARPQRSRCQMLLKGRRHRGRRYTLVIILWSTTLTAARELSSVGVLSKTRSKRL